MRDLEGEAVVGEDVVESLVGALDGCFVGLVVGALEGEAVVGEVVGSLVFGDLDGCFVGLDVGLAVGL